MDWSLVIFIVIGLGVILLNVAATKYIAAAPAYSSAQKKIQITLIWAIPIFGAGLFSWFLWQDRQERRRRDVIGNNTSITNQEAITHAIASEHRGGR